MSMMNDVEVYDYEEVVVYNKDKTRCARLCKPYTVLAITGFILLLAGIAFVITQAFKGWVEDAIKKGIVLKPGNEAYRKWRHPLSPSYMTYYMFNVTNPQEVVSGGIPNLQQLGPYTYREINEKDVVIRHNYSDSSITFLSKSSYVYDKDMSCISCDPMIDKIININLPFLTIIQTIIRHVSTTNPRTLGFVKAVLDEIFNRIGFKAFQKLTVNQLLWGYTDPFLNNVKEILEKLATTFRSGNVSMKFPGKFSLQNNNTANLYTIDSGEDDYNIAGEYLMWNKITKLPCWNSKYANMMNGTDGHRFKPDISKDDVIYVLVASAFRSFKLIYDSIVHVKGIKLYRFVLAPEQFIKGESDKGFCVTGKHNKCLISGLMDVSRCYPQNAPVVFSLPHFYLGDKCLLKTINGLLLPRIPIHATFIDVEPHTGLTMHGNKRIQMNIAVTNISGITAFEKWTNVYLPVMYVDEHGHISDDDASDFKKGVLLPLKLAYAAPFVLITIGLILLMVAQLLFYRRHRKNKGSERYYTEDKSYLLSSSSSTNCEHKKYGTSDSGA